MLVEEILLYSIPSLISQIYIEEKGLTICFDKNNIKLLSNFLFLSSLVNYNTLLDLWATDTLQKNTHRFHLYYMLLATKKNTRIYLKCIVKTLRGLAKTFSLTERFASASFLEREVWDLFGIFFIAHPDLRRIVTDYGFNGFPLRKDFPVTGFREIRYDDEKAKVIYEPIKFTQAYRMYGFESPWSKNI
jgi:NADH:ubiquinone oxidoreductase subunit C